MKSFWIAALSPFVLAACATTGGVQSDLGQADEKGFVLRPDGALFHPGTGLHCPSAINDIPRTQWEEYREDLDTGCNYSGFGQILTIYAFKTDLTMMEEVQGSVSAAMQNPNAQFYEFSESQTETCQDVGDAYNIQGQLLSGLAGLMGGAGTDNNEINVETGPGAGPLPYLAAAMEGDGVRSFVAVSKADGWSTKVRYTTPVEDNDEETRQAECEVLHSVLKDVALSRGDADGKYEVSGLQALLEATDDS